MTQVTFHDIDPKVRKLSMIGLALGMMIACMDGTIVGTCAAEIARDLGGMELYSWLLRSDRGGLSVSSPSGERKDACGLRKWCKLLVLKFYWSPA